MKFRFMREDNNSYFFFSVSVVLLLQEVAENCHPIHTSRVWMEKWFKLMFCIFFLLFLKVDFILLYYSLSDF